MSPQLKSMEAFLILSPGVDMISIQMMQVTWSFDTFKAKKIYRSGQKRQTFNSFFQVFPSNAAIKVGATIMNFDMMTGFLHHLHKQKRPIRFAI